MRSRGVFVVTMCISLIGCSSQDARPNARLRFTGVWRETFIEAASQFTKEVVADGDRFTIVERNASPNATEAGPKRRVFDGHRYFERDDSDPGSPDKGSVHESNEHGVSYLRFWMWTPQGPGTPGETILARETIVYESKEPVTDTIFRRWVDKETGILLKEEQIRAQTNAPKFLT